MYLFAAERNLFNRNRINGTRLLESLAAIFVQTILASLSSDISRLSPF